MNNQFKDIADLINIETTTDVIGVRSAYKGSVIKEQIIHNVTVLKDERLYVDMVERTTPMKDFILQYPVWMHPTAISHIGRNKDNTKFYLKTMHNGAKVVSTVYKLDGVEVTKEQLKEAFTEKGFTKFMEPKSYTYNHLNNIMHAAVVRVYNVDNVTIL